MTSKGKQMVLDIIREQQPDVVFLAPVCGPWSIMQSINNQKVVAEKREGEDSGPTLQQSGRPTLHQ